MRTGLRGAGFLGLAGLLWSSVAGSADAPRALPLRYEVSTGDKSVLPEGCANPYRDVNLFMEFYEDTISEMAVERGPRAKGVADLFAVSELRAAVKDLFPNLQEESPLDRLLMTQLCHYQKISLQNPEGGLRPSAITSDDSKLHDHLAIVAARLYRDSRGVVVEALREQTKLRDKLRKLALKRSDIRKAREIGRDLVEDVFSSAESEKRIK